MYVAAQRVRTVFEEGINAFLYAHGDYLWPVPPEPEHEPGALVDMFMTVDTAGGNQVRSYLDIVAPDGMWWSDVRDGFVEFARARRTTAFPWNEVINNCRFRVSMDRLLAHSWRQELVHLYRACEMLHHR